MAAIHFRVDCGHSVIRSENHSVRAPSEYPHLSPDLESIDRQLRKPSADELRSQDSERKTPHNRQPVDASGIRAESSQSPRFTNRKLQQLSTAEFGVLKRVELCFQVLQNDGVARHITAGHASGHHQMESGPRWWYAP